MDEKPFLSLVIPATTSRRTCRRCCLRVGAALQSIGKPFEVILIDDGSTDQTPALLADGQKKYPWLRVLRMRKNVRAERCI